MGVARAGTADQIVALLTTLGLPIGPPPLDRRRVLSAMLADKKNRGGVVHAALIASFGTMARNGERWTHPLDLGKLSELI
jgi:3-dehydroquinate synthetase